MTTEIYEKGFELIEQRLKNNEKDELREVLETYEGTRVYSRVRRILENIGMRGRSKIEDVEVLRDVVDQETKLWR